MNTKKVNTETDGSNMQELFISAIKAGKKINSLSAGYLTAETKKPRYPMLGKWAGERTIPGIEKSFLIQNQNGLTINYDEKHSLVSVRFEDQQKFIEIVSDYDPTTIIVKKIFTMKGLLPYCVTFPVQNIESLYVNTKYRCTN